MVIVDKTGGKKQMIVIIIVIIIQGEVKEKKKEKGNMAYGILIQIPFLSSRLAPWCLSDKYAKNQYTRRKKSKRGVRRT